MLAATQRSELFSAQLAVLVALLEQPQAVLQVPRERPGPMSPTISLAGLVLQVRRHLVASPQLNAADLVAVAVAVDQASQEEPARLSA